MKKSNISKFILSIAFVLLAFACFGGAFLQNASTQKTENAYAAGGYIEKIESATDLANFADSVNGGTSYSGKIVYLTKDIDLSGRAWTPIGSSTNPFDGTFDGRGFTISGLTILSDLTPSLSHIGLFGYTYGATIRNLTLKLVNIDYNSTAVSIGALVGCAKETNIFDCATFGSVKTNGNANIGGIAGDLDVFGTMSNCYSYARVDGAYSSYVGGLVGYAGYSYDEDECPYEPNIKNSFFAGITSSGYSGLYASGIANVTDCYTIGCLPLYNSYRGFTKETISAIVQYKKVDNTSYWIKDTSGMMSQGSGRQVLKGVGNIILEKIKNVFNKATGEYTLSSSSTSFVKVVTYDTSSTTTNTSEEIKADTNNVFTWVRYKRNVPDQRQAIAQRGSFFNNGTSGGNNNNTFIVSPDENSKILLTEGGSKIKFCADGDFSSDTYKPETSYSTASKNFYVPKNLQGYYSIETSERGKLVAIQSNAKTYVNSNRKEQSSTGSKFEISNYITMTISGGRNDDYNKDYSNLISEKVGKNLKLFYRPYGEAYTVTFANNGKTITDGFDYLGKIKGYKRYQSTSATSSSSNQSSINSADITADKSVSLTGELSKNYSFDESSGVTQDCVINYYFDNVFNVTIGDGRAEANFGELFKQWYSNYSVESGGTKVAVGVMLYEKIADKGIGYNGKIIKDIYEGDELYPFWSDFACGGITEKVDNGDAVTYFQPTSGGLAPNGGLGRWKANSLEWYPIWRAKNQTITIVTNSLKNSKNEEINTVDSIQNKNGGTLTSSNNGMWKLNTTTSTTPYTFNVVQKGGHKLKSVVLTMKIGNQSQEFTIDDTTKDFDYYGCQLSYNANENRYKVKSRFRYSLSQESGNYVFDFETLIGIEKIEFNFQKYEYDALVKTNIKSLINGYNEAPITIKNKNITRDNGVRLSEILANGTNLQDNEKLFSVNETILIKDIKVKQGYKLYSIVLPTETLSKNTIGITKSDIKQSADGSYSVELTLNSIGAKALYVDDIVIIFNIDRIGKDFTFSLNDVDINNDDWKNFEFGINISVDGAKTDRSIEPRKMSQLNTSLLTDDEVTLTLNGLPYNIKLSASDITVKGIRDGYIVGAGSEPNSFVISNIIVDENAGEYSIGIDCSVPKVDLSIINQSIANISGQETVKVLSTKNATVPYGSILAVTKDAGSDKLIVSIKNEAQGINEVFNYDLDSKIIEQLSILFENGQASNIKITSNSVVDWKMYLTYSNLSKYDTSDTYKLYLKYTTRAISVHTGDTLIKNASTTIDNFTLDTSNNQIAGTVDTILADNKLGYKFLGFYVVQKDSNGKVLGDTFASTLYSGNTSFKYSLNTQSANATQITIEKSTLYIVRVYEAKMLTAIFDTTLKDEVSNQNLNVTLSSTEKVEIEYNATILASKLPNVQIDGMYDFVCWQSGTVQINNREFRTDEKYVIDDNNNTVTFKIKANPTDVNLTLYSDSNTQFSTITISYGTTDYSKLPQPSKFGYTLAGWKYMYKDSDGEVNKSKDGQIYVTIQNGKIVQNSCKKFDIQSKTVDFVAVYDANIISNIIFRAGGINNEGKFVSGQKEYTAQVMFGTSNYQSELFNLTTFVPTWQTDYATYEFAYFIFNGNKNKIFDPNSTDEARRYVIQSNEISGEMIFTAYYKVVDFVTPTVVGNESSWTYDAQSRSLSIDFAGKQNTNVLTYSYAWYKDGKTLAGQTYVILDNIKNVVDSGKYTCKIKVNAQNEYAFTESPIEKETQEFLITISPKEIWFTQNGEITTELVKVFDNTNKINSTVDYGGICGSDSITVIAIYDNVNVGTNIPMTITITSIGSTTDIRNYTYPTNITGTITPYELNFVLKNNSNNYIVKNGEDNLQINIKEYYTIASDDSSFIQKYGFAIDYQLKTSQNIIGRYSFESQNANKILLTFSLKSGNQNNFIGKVNDDFFIKESDENSITISIKVLSNDNKSNEQVDNSLAYISANSIISSDGDKGHIFNINNNNSSNITIIEKRDYLLRNPNINLKLIINEQSKDYGYIYWIENWQVLCDGNIVDNNFADNSNITYTIESGSVKQIIINCYITTLSSVEYDYNLADGENLDDKVSSTKFAYAKPISYSIANYNAKFPIPTRDGFDFVAWTNGTTNVTNSTIWDKKYTKLTAIWQLQDIAVDNGNVKENFVYDSVKHTYTFTVTNSNTKAIEYTYKWSSTAKIAGEQADSTLRVKNVKNSGVYTLTITATNKGLSKSLTRVVDVTITPYELLKTNIEILKQYDKSADMSTMMLDGVSTEKVYITGSYYDKNAGALLNKSSIKYVVKNGDVEIESQYNDNYNLDLSKISDQSKIVAKDISINFNDSSKVFDKLPLQVTGEFNEKNINFNYTIKTAKVINNILTECGDVGTYNQQNGNLKIEIKNELLSNFNITLSGTLTINYKSISNVDVEWVGDRNVVFDGKQHTLTLSDEFKDAVESYKYEKDNVTLSSLPITVGEYKVIAKFKENCGYNVQEEIQATLNISQRILNITYDSSNGKIEKYYDSTNVVTKDISQFNIETIVSGYEPTFVYNYRTVNAGENIAIDILLDENSENNKNYILAFPNGTIYGTINKVSVDVVVSGVSKQYDGTNIFEVNSDNIQVTGLVTGEDVDGSVNFIAKEVARYTNHNSTLEINKDALLFGNKVYSTNYEISSFAYDIEIIKAKLVLACSPTSPYTYNGLAIDIKYELTRSDNIKNASLPNSLEKVYYIKNGSSYEQINYQPLQVGDYQIEFRLSANDELNFEIISTQTQFNYTIIKRNLSIRFQTEYAYTGNKITYKVDKAQDDIYILSKDIADNTLGAGDSISWNFVTTGKDCGTYYVAQRDFVNPAEITIYKDGEDYTRNYEIIIHAEAQIIIKQAGIDRSQVIISSSQNEYNAQTHSLTFSVNGSIEDFTYKSIKRSGVLVQGEENIKYAGEYALEIELQNYKIANNKPFTYTITQRDVDLDLLEISKVYDGTIDVEDTDYKFKADKNICKEDENLAYIEAKYDNKNVGEKKKIKFVLKSGNPLIENSYNLLTTFGFGDITKLDQTISLKTYSKFYDGKTVEIDISNFTPTELENREILSGKVLLNIKDVGEYDISTNTFDLSKLKIVLASGTSEGLDNYNLSFVGTLEIKPALVTVNVKYLQYVYNAKEQLPTFEESIYDSKGEIVDDFEYKVDYLQNNVSVTPINAGEYNIKISLPENSNYRFIRIDNGQAIQQKELIFNETLKIAKRKIAIDVRDTINRRYKDGINATYQVEAKDIIDPTAERTEGLLSIHKLVATLSTNGSVAKTYQVNGLPNNLVFDNSSEIYIKSLAITQMEDDVTQNYSIEYLTCTIIISNTSEEFDTEALESLVYNGKDKFASGEVYVTFLIDGTEHRFDVNNNTYNGQTIISEFTYNNTRTDNIINAGSYSVRLQISVPGFNPIDTTFTFEVKQKEILVVDCNTSKEYDSTSDVLGNLTSQDICSKDGNIDDVTIVGNYYNDNGDIVNTIGNDYVIKFTISGQDSSNYVIDNLNLKGEIKARKISLTIKDGYVLTFNNKVQYIDYENLTMTAGSVVSGQTLAGRIKVNNQNAGTYDLNLSNIDITELKVKKDENDFTSNYEFIFAGVVTINSKNVDVTVNPFNLEYNGTVQTIDEYLTFDSLEEELQDVAKTALTVSYDKEVVDAGDYVATVFSNTNNFVFNVLDYNENKIPFTVLKRGIIFTLGNIQKSYNPTSDHRSKIEPTSVTGLIAGQELKGEYRLSKVGLNVGTYTQDPNDNKDGYIIFENLEIIAKGENILEKNYDILSQFGTIEIIPFKISNGDAYLSQTQVVYSKTEAIDGLAFTFFDANKQLQTITTQNTELGTISLVEDSAVNVGTYHIKVSIKNCELVDGDEYEFEIIPFTITEIDYVSQKEYDATSSVINSIGSKTLTSSQVFAGDSIEIEGNYIDRDNIAVKNASQDDYSIVFAIKNADTFPAKNYMLNVTGNGKITQRVITLNVNKELTYKSSGEYSIPYKPENFTMVGTLVDGQTLEGIVKFTKQDTLGVIDLTQIDLSGLTVIDGESINQTSNYLFRLDGKVSVVKSQIKIDFSDSANTYIYSNSVVQINPIITFADVSNGDTLPTFVYNYKSQEYDSEDAPKNVGNYTFTVLLNSTFYEFATSNTFAFEITPYTFVVNDADVPTDRFSKNFNNIDPELSFTMTTPLNELINLYFTRTLGESVGVYDIQLQNWDNKNYTVTLESGKGLFTIKKASSTTVTILATAKNINLLQKQYDTQNIGSVDVTLLDYEASGETLIGTITFEEGVNVGSYQVESWTLSSSNFEQFNLISEVEYQIKQKDIVLKGENLDKPYDKSTKLYGTITILDASNIELDESIYHLSAYGQYADSMVSDNVNILVNFAGASTSNFNVTNTLSGKITKRNVKVVPNQGQEAIYGTNNLDILYSLEDLDTTDFNGDLNSEVTGNLYIDFLAGETKYVVGNYQIKSNITSNNFNLSFDDGVQFTITQKELTISNSKNFIKEFDGDNIVLGDFTIESGLISGDVVEISAKFYNDKLEEDSSVATDKIVIFTLSGTDGKNYFASNVKGSITNKLVKLNFVYNFDEKSIINPNLIEDNETSSFDLIYDKKIGDTNTYMPQPRHEGYTFVGWYFDKEYTNQVKLDTMIDSSNWPIDEVEKFAYAKWEIKSFDVKIVNVTKVNGIYSDDASLQGGTTITVDGKYNYYSTVALNNVATPKNGYVFVGFSDDINASVNDDFINNGYTVLAKDNVIYAKFDPKTVMLTLFANEGQFTNSQKWTFESGNTLAIVEVDFNSKLSDYGITIPDVSRDGYAMSGWKDKNGADVSFDANTILGESYFPKITLYVDWTPRNYKLVLNANGGIYSNFDSNIWTVEERDENGNVIKVSKNVAYNSKLGELIEPTKKGWTFDSYTNAISTEFVFKQLGDLTSDAQYTENNYVLTIISKHHDIKVEIKNKDNVLISNYSLTAGNSDRLTIDVMTTYNATITATDTMGYIFKDWTSTYNLTDSQSATIQILEFMQDETLTANYDFKENTITLKVNDKTKGYVYSGEYSTKDVGEITFTAKTESVVNLTAMSLEGYQLSGWLVDSNGIKFNLSGSDKDAIRELSDFICDITITVNFEPKTVNITLIADEMKGAITIDGVINNVPSYTCEALVDSIFTFIVTANHGYSVDTNTANWLFETTSTNKGDFAIRENGNVYTITFTKFYENGTINIPFTTNSYNVKFVAVYRNENTFNRDLDADNLVTLQRSGQSDVVLNSNSPYEAIYKTQVKLIPRLDIQEGYTFSSWSKSGSSEYMLSSLEGLVASYDDNSIDLEIIDDITVYLIYTINTYTIKFSTNDYQKGNITYNDGIPQTNFAITVRYGYNAQKVEAQNSEHFVFEKWVKVVDGAYQDYSTDEILQLTNVKSDMEFVAIFKGQSIVITVKLVLPEEEILEPVTDFGKLEITENAVTKLIRTETQTNAIVYEISTLASEVVTLKLLEENGFVLANYNSTDNIITLSNILESTEVIVSLRARYNTVLVELTGDVNGAELTYDSNTTKGLITYRDFGNQRSFEFNVRTGGKVGMQLKINPGYMLVSNEYFGTPVITPDGITSLSNGLISNIKGDMVIGVEIKAFTYNVTFNFNYENCPESVASTIKSGESIFNPTLPSTVMNPTRAKYKFVGWGLQSGSMDASYVFENGNIYYYSFNGQSKVKTLGFYGSEFAEVSHTAGIDYECTLYAMWELITYKIDVVLVPTSTLSKIAFDEVFPAKEGRKPIYQDLQKYEVVGVRYEPGSQVIINAPYGNRGYKYYGWSYEEGIKDRTLLNTEPFNIEMPEEDIVVYLYYTMEVSVESYGNGEASISTKEVLYGESVTVNALPNDGYLFYYWTVNGTTIQNSTSQMNFVIEQPTVISAKFIGKEVDVRLKQVDNAKLSVDSKIQNVEGNFRVGDTIIFGISDITYGYYHKAWDGEYSGVIGNKTYRITKEDAVRGYVEFSLVISQKSVRVEFVVDGAEGGEFEFDGQKLISITKTYNYDNYLDIVLLTAKRYELVSLTLNDKNIDSNVRQLLIHKDNGFDSDSTNIIKAKFRKILWVEVYEMFAGYGTEGDPYVIYNERQLSAMAYLINNNISAETTIPYAQGYYVLKSDMNLDERFWQPIGTKDNPFDGTFDYIDNGISNLELDEYYEVINQNGLFGYVTENAKFIRSQANYTLAIVLISSIVLLIILIVLILWLWIRHKKKKMEKLATISSVAQNQKMMDEILKSNKKAGQKPKAENLDKDKSN